jgi:hypothetical protein
LEDRASTRPTSWQGRMLLQQGNFASVLNLIVKLPSLQYFGKQLK